VRLIVPPGPSWAVTALAMVWPAEKLRVDVEGMTTGTGVRLT
jgi:hypothetical protein